MELECTRCGSPNLPKGKLGSYNYYQCESCGWWYEDEYPEWGDTLLDLEDVPKDSWLNIFTNPSLD